MNYITDGLKVLFSEIGMVGWLVIVIYVGLFGLSLIRQIVIKEQRKQQAAERLKMQKQRHSAYMQRHSMNMAVNRQRLAWMKAKTEYYQRNRFARRQPSFNGVRTQGGKVYGKWQ